jgi:alanine dehydrogenase
MGNDVRLLSRSEVEGLLDLGECMDAVEEAFRRSASKTDVKTGVLGMHVPGGGFHAKAATMMAGAEGRRYFVLKLNANFPGNPARHGLPTIQGLLMLVDATSGSPLCVMDSMSITILRTAAATGVATRYLALPDASRAMIIGCGAQARAQLQAVHLARPLTEALAYDIDAARATTLAREASAALGISVRPVTDLREGALASDIIVTCTPSHQAFLDAGDVKPGTFIAAVGADSDTKSEITPRLMAAAAVVTDNIDQCVTIGDLQHAIAHGAMRRDQVRGELADVIADPARRRRSDDEIIVFDSTGVALQDVAAAALVFEASVRGDAGVSFPFA